jgi:hypothetical protein
MQGATGQRIAARVFALSSSDVVSSADVSTMNAINAQTELA